MKKKETGSTTVENLIQNDINRDEIVEARGLTLHARPQVEMEKLQQHLREVLRLLHVDLEDENIADTPRRWAASLVAMTSGYDFTDVKKLSTMFQRDLRIADETQQNLVVIGGTYKTLCAHHILPFFGQFIIGYIPDRKIIGASKIPRIVEVHMRKLQSQEYLAHDVADTVEAILQPKGVAVWMGGIHLCMVMRGVGQESSFMETNVLRGGFLKDEKTRHEFMSIVNRRGTRDGNIY
jgi:GTP cyclohydrolase I